MTHAIWRAALAGCMRHIPPLILAATGLSALADAAAPPVFTAPERALIKQFGPWPADLPPDAGNAFSGLAWAETLGQQLFNDTRLSGNGRLACATCHQAVRGFSDGLPTALGTAPHTRNTQGLLNVGQQRWFGWDGGTDSLWAASLRPILSDIEMAADIETVASRFRDDHVVARALATARPRLNPDDMTSEELVVTLAKAIGAYTRTLQSPATAFDAFRTALERDDIDAQARYPLDAQRGLKTFIGAGRCFVCHSGPLFSNGEFHDIGRPFFTGVGQVDPGRYTGIQRVRADTFNLLGIYNTTHRDFEAQKTASVTLGQVNFGQWRTPSLRNLKLTAPYMHDG
ncbi:MAG: cytochrome c peroxidase, partial [Pseudomonadota bacterium]